jgi:hypothetical protein
MVNVRRYDVIKVQVDDVELEETQLHLKYVHALSVPIPTLLFLEAFPPLFRPGLNGEAEMPGVVTPMFEMKPVMEILEPRIPRIMQQGSDGLRRVWPAFDKVPDISG